jgi:hypothetical protein
MFTDTCFSDYTKLSGKVLGRFVTTNLTGNGTKIVYETNSTLECAYQCRINICDYEIKYHCSKKYSKLLNFKFN